MQMLTSVARTTSVIQGGRDARADFGGSTAGQYEAGSDHRPESFRCPSTEVGSGLSATLFVAAGYDVSVVCPKGKNDPSYEVIDTVRLYKYRPYAPGGSKLGFVAEYAYSFSPRHGRRCSPAVAAGSRSCRRAIRLTSSGRSRWCSGWRTGPSSSSTITTCAPNFSGRGSLTCRSSRTGACYALEWRTYRPHDHVISTNDLYAAASPLSAAALWRASGRHGRSHRPQTRTSSGAAPTDPHCGGPPLSLSRTWASWDLRTAWTSSVRAADHRGSSTLGRDDIGFTLHRLR